MIKMLLWEIRTSKNITLTELAAMCGLSKSTINNYENSKTYPDLRQMEKLAKALDCNMTDLFDSEIK